MRSLRFNSPWTGISCKHFLQCRIKNCYRYTNDTKTWEQNWRCNYNFSINLSWFLLFYIDSRIVSKQNPRYLGFYLTKCENDELYNEYKCKMNTLLEYQRWIHRLYYQFMRKNNFGIYFLSQPNEFHSQLILKLSSNTNKQLEHQS